MKKLVLSLIGLFIILTGCSTNSKDIITPPLDMGTYDDMDILIDIKGAIIFPGVYSVKKNSLLKDVIKVAGGFASNADIEKVNLVKEVEANEMIIIPFKGSGASTSNLININTASLKELTQIPKIGEVKAKAIIEYRVNNGPFNKISDIMKVSGISETIFNQIKTFIMV